MAIFSIPDTSQAREWFAEHADQNCCGNHRRLTQPDVLWVTAYEIGRCYGGPEEGGWWYDVGHVLASIPCRTDSEVTEAIERLAALYRENYEPLRTRYSVIGEEDLGIYVEEKAGEDYPKGRPHYE